MPQPTIIEQKSVLLYPKVLFNRPLNRLQMPQIGLIGGQLETLKVFNDVYTAIKACNNRLIVAVPRQSATIIGSTAQIIMDPAGKKSQFDHEAADMLTECNLIVLSPGLMMTSAWHLQLEKLLSVAERPLMFTHEALPIALASPELLSTAGSSLILTTEQAIRAANAYNLAVSIQPARGIFNKIDLMYALSEHTNAQIVLVDQNQVIIYHYTLSSAGLLQMATGDFLKHRGDIIGVLASLSAGNVDPQSQFEAMIDGLYVFRQAYEQGEADLGVNIGRIINNVV